MERKTTSIKINPDIWKQVRMHCIQEDIDVSEYLEKLIKKDLKIKDLNDFVKKEEKTKPHIKKHGKKQ